MMNKKMAVSIKIPDDLEFSDLNLRRDADGGVSFNTEVINKICLASGIDSDLVIGVEDNVAGILVRWYIEHRQAGGEVDSVAEDLIAEVAAEDQHGDGISYPPGRA